MTIAVFVCSLLIRVKGENEMNYDCLVFNNELFGVHCRILVERTVLLNQHSV